MLKNIGANWMLALLKIASAFVLMPFVIRMLGTVQYGAWILIGSITGYMALLILGVPATSVRFMAQSAEQKNTARLNELVASFTGLYLLLGLICVVVGIGLYAAFTLVFHIPAAVLGPAKIAFIVVIVTTSSGFILQLPYGIFAAHHDFVLANLILAASTAFRFVATLVLLTWMPTLVIVAIVQLAGSILEFIVAWVVIARKYPHIRLGVATLQWGMLKQILGFSAFVMLLTVAGQLSYQTDALVIGAFLDIKHIAYFNVASSLMLYYLEFLIGIAAVVMPMATRLQTENSVPGLQEMFLKWSKIALGLTLLGGLYLIFLGPRFLAWWVGPDFELPAGGVLQILMLGFVIYLPVRAVAQPMLMGLGKPGLPAMGFLVTGVVNLLLSMALAGPLGLIGVALGTAVPNAFYSVYLVRLACREVNLSIMDYFRYVYGRAALASVPVVAMLYLFRTRLDVHTFWQVALTGVAAVVLWGVLWFLFVLRGDRYLGDSLAALRARFVR